MASLGIVADTVSEEFDQALDLISQWGIRNIELYHLWHKSVLGLSDDEVGRAASLVRDHGMVVTDIASLIMRCPPTDRAEEENLALFQRAVEIGRSFGTDRIRCYAYLKQPDLEVVWPRILRTYEKLIRLAEAEEVMLLLENSSYANLQWAEEMRRFFNTMDNPRLRLLWDAGNAFALGDPTSSVEAWQMLKDRIAHIHLKDSDAHGSNRWVPVGAGGFDLKGLLGALAKDEYSGVVSLEAYFDTEDPLRREKVRQSVDGVRQAAKETGLALSE